ncbi:MAG: heavy metal translocating P-type ATPase [Chloroflexota bacterium]
MLTAKPTAADEAEEMRHAQNVILRSEADGQMSEEIDHSPNKAADTAANQTLAIASSSFALAIAGALLYPPLTVLGITGAIVGSRYFVETSYQEWHRTGSLGMNALITVNHLLLLTTGYYVILNFSIWIWACYIKLLARIEDNSKKDFIDVFKGQPRSVWVYTDGVEVETPFEALKGGDIVVVHTGETIPIDGTIIDGRVLVDQHILTGESQPVEKGVDDEVFALTVVLSGSCHVHAEKTGDETTSAQIGRILNETVDFKTTMQLKAKRVIDQSVWPTLLLSALSYPFVGAIGPLTVLYSNPKHRLLVPASFGVISYFNQASKRQLLIKDGRTLELLNHVDTVVFDKTGTLTEEQPHVGQVHTCNGYTEQQIMRFAAAAEHKQSHPIARAILQKADAMQLSVPEIDEASYKVGYGLTVRIEGQLVRVGSIRFIEAEGLTVPPALCEAQLNSHDQGHSLVLVAINEDVGGAIELLPTVRPEAKAVIQRLRTHHGITRMAIISGDHEAPTKKLASELGIDQYFAEVLPEDKANLIGQLQAEGRSVCYVGDGINDAIALKKANVSVSLRGASTVATDTAQVILMSQKLDQLCDLFELTREFESNMKGIFATTIFPALLAIGGVFFLQLGVTYVVIINQMGLVGGISYALWPLLRNNRRQSRLLVESERAGHQ